MGIGNIIFLYIIPYIEKIFRKRFKLPIFIISFRGYIDMTEYVVNVREKGEVTIPKELREKYNIKHKTRVKIIPKAEGILIKPEVADPVGQLRGIAEGLWPEDVTSVDIVKEIRRRADLEAREKL